MEAGPRRAAGVSREFYEKMLSQEQNIIFFLLGRSGETTDGQRGSSKSNRDCQKRNWD